MLEATLLSRLGEDICLKFQPTNHKYVYLCDCGAASDLTIKDCHDLGALFVSHTHIDHFCNGGSTGIRESYDGVFPQKTTNQIPDLVILWFDGALERNDGNQRSVLSFFRTLRSNSRPSMSKAEISISGPLTFTIMKWCPTRLLELNQVRFGAKFSRPPPPPPVVM